MTPLPVHGKFNTANHTNSRQTVQEAAGIPREVAIGPKTKAISAKIGKQQDVMWMLGVDTRFADGSDLEKNEVVEMKRLRTQNNPKGSTSTVTVK